MFLVFIGKSSIKSNKYNEEQILHNYLLIPYCGKGSFLYFDWTGKLTAVAT